MKQQSTLIYAAAAVAAVAVVAVARRKSGTSSSSGSTLGASGDTARLGGVQSIYNMSAGQQAAVDAAIAANWKSLDQSVFASQPDFWV